MPPQAATTNMFKCSIRDLLWLLVLSAVLSAWYSHYRAMVEHQRTIERQIANEQQEYYRMETTWNEFARQLPQQMNQISNEYHEPYTIHLVAQYESFTVRKRLRALGVAPPKAMDGRQGGASMTPDEEQDL